MYNAIEENLTEDEKINAERIIKTKEIQRWILMRLRHHTFFGVDQLN